MGELAERGGERSGGGWGGDSMGRQREKRGERDALGDHRQARGGKRGGRSLGRLGMGEPALGLRGREGCRKGEMGGGMGSESEPKRVEAF